MCIARRWLTVPGVVTVAAVAFLTSGSMAQVAYQEPPDLHQQGVGNVAPGLNTIRGGVAGTIIGGIITGDAQDQFSFGIPNGVTVSGVQLVISNYTQVFATSGVYISGPGTSIEIPFSGNGTINLTGALNPGAYTVLVYANNFDDSSGSISFSHETRITAAFANDACANAAPIGLGPTAFNTSSSTTDGPDHPVQCNFFSNPGITKDQWFTYTADQTGQITAQTCGSSYDTEIAVYAGTNCGTLQSAILACNDDAETCGSNSRQSLVQWVAQPGQTFLIRVGGFNNQSGAGTLTLSRFTSGACCNQQNGACLPMLESTCNGVGLTFIGWGVTCSPATCTACPADFNHVDGVTVQDIFAYLSAWTAGCP
jgi:hypothetical protein